MSPSITADESEASPPSSLHSPYDVHANNNNMNGLRIFLRFGIPLLMGIAFFAQQSSCPCQNNFTTVEGDDINIESTPAPKWCSFALKGSARKFPTYRWGCRNCTSQFNQDEILRRIFDTIGTTNRRCVEFGFGYNNAQDLTLESFNTTKKLSSGLNTHALVREGWTPTLFDAEYENPRINLHKRVLTPDNIGDAFRAAEVPLEADYVSIDVDSVDVWLLHGLLSDGYRPRVISIEYNSNFPVDMPISCERKWSAWKHKSRVFGSSASAINMVAEMFRYKVVEIMPRLDMFLVRKDILTEVCTPDSLPSFEELAREFVFDPNHKWCNANEAQRFVDFPLAVQGLERQAKEKAIEQIKELNQRFQEKFNEPFCNL